VIDLGDQIRALVREVVREELARARGADLASGGDDYLSTDEASRVASVAAGTLRRWIREGRLIGHRAGREIRVRRRDLDALLCGHSSSGEVTDAEIDAMAAHLTRKRIG